MDSGTQTLDATAVLAAARRFRREANAAEAGVLAQAIEWCRIHQVDDPGMAATWHDSRGCDTGIPIAGEGAPQVSEFAVAEFATALGLSAMSGRNLVAQAWELAHRLPKTWARVVAGDLAPWRARRIADDTLTLSFDAAAWVDQMVAPFAHKTGPAQVQRLVQTAITRFMPDYAAEQRDRAAEQRYFTIDTDQVSFAGTARIHGELDLADALDLEDAVRAGAQQLADLGNQDTLDVRRAAAVGMLARGDQPLHFEKAETPVPPATPTSTREIVLYVHLSEDAIRAGDTEAPVWLEDAGGRLLTAGQVADWCGRPDTTKVTVKPVIDLKAFGAVDAYQVPTAMADQVRLRDRTCVFPWCHRPARSCDLDHINPYLDMAQVMDQGGPPGQTNTENLAPLCRLHHRMKTHSTWTYSMVEPGTYLWHSPHGHTWLRDPSGTTDLTPPQPEPPSDPPERRTS